MLLCVRVTALAYSATKCRGTALAYAAIRTDLEVELGYELEHGGTWRCRLAPFSTSSFTIASCYIAPCASSVPPYTRSVPLMA
eukprot:654163-Rhodomonas_salina.1